MRLFHFAFCHEYEKKIQGLAMLCPEKWSFGTQSDNVILKNYIEHTFSKLYEEDSILLENDYALFNTGLYTAYYEPILAYFTKNKIPERQLWFFDGFYTSYQLGMMGIAALPKRANYLTILLIWFLTQIAKLYHSTPIYLEIGIIFFAFRR